MTTPDDDAQPARTRAGPPRGRGADEPVRLAVGTP